MPRQKKVLQEIALDSGSDSEPSPPRPDPIDVPVKKVRVKAPKEVPAVNKARQDALKKANEARLRQKIEKELYEKRREEAENERKLEQKIILLLQKQQQHAHRQKKPSRRAPPSSPQTPPPCEKSQEKYRAPQAPSPQKEIAKSAPIVDMTSDPVMQPVSSPERKIGELIHTVNRPPYRISGANVYPDTSPLYHMIFRR